MSDSWLKIREILSSKASPELIQEIKSVLEAACDKPDYNLLVDYIKAHQDEFVNDFIERDGPGAPRDMSPFHLLLEDGTFPVFGTRPDHRLINAVSVMGNRVRRVGPIRLYPVRETFRWFFNSPWCEHLTELYACNSGLTSGYESTEFQDEWMEKPTKLKKLSLYKGDHTASFVHKLLEHPMMQNLEFLSLGGNRYRIEDLTEQLQGKLFPNMRVLDLAHSESIISVRDILNSGAFPAIDVVCYSLPHNINIKKVIVNRIVEREYRMESPQHEKAFFAGLLHMHSIKWIREHICPRFDNYFHGYKRREMIDACIKEWEDAFPPRSSSN